MDKSLLEDKYSFRKVTAPQALNDKLRSKLGKSERRTVLLVETLAYVHELIDPLILRTGEAAGLLKQATKTITITKEYHQEAPKIVWFGER